LPREMRHADYVPDTKMVPHGVEEEQKDLSQREAWALPLKIMKNLGVCGDYHTAIKFISVISGPETI
ncbi:hypothetical protein SELMODRAFT_49788, partial [Selaginella moellendorffii]